MDGFETTYTYDGDTLILEDMLAGGRGGPPMHLHPSSSERFVVHSGVLTLRLAQEEIVLKAGESYTVDPGVVHSFHTRDSDDVRVTITITPAHDMEHFFRGMARAEREGRHPLLQLAVMHQGLDDMGFYMAGPPVWAQKVMFTVLAPVARLMGYRAR